MAYSLKEEIKKPERLSGGHRMCAGCGAPVAIRAVLRALEPEDKAVICSATGCLEVSTCIYPYTSWRDSFIHSAFENAAATITGAEAAYTALKQKGRMDSTKEYKFIAFAGDGGTYDIGLQALSGAVERGHDFVYVCYDNGAYMNTGIQRSSATMKYTDTTTTPAGEMLPGKEQFKKDITMIMAAHNLPFVAQTAPVNNFKDLHEKSKKALYTKGPCFLNILAPCPRGWRYDTPLLMQIIKMAVDCCIWPLYEVEYGKFKLSYKPKNKLPVEDYLRQQGRYGHLFKAENEHLIQKIQNDVDEKWAKLLDLCRES